MTTTIHLVRHATYDMLDRGILAGRSSGWPLNEAGRVQAMALAAAMAQRTLRAVIASPLERAQETALAIAAPHELAVQTEPAWNEVDFGDWTGTPFAELHGRPEWRRFNALRSVAAPPGGESMLQVQTRAAAALSALAARYPDCEIAVVSHGDVIKAALAHLLGTPLDLFQRIDVRPGSRSTVVIGADFVRVLSVNLPVFAAETPHHPTT